MGSSGSPQLHELHEGHYGAFHLHWNQRHGIWHLTATSRRALDFLRIGSPGTRMLNGSKVECRVFSSDARIARTVAKKLRESEENASRLSTMTLPQITGLEFGATDDGWLWIDGPRLPLYRTYFPVAAKRSLDKSDYWWQSRVYVRASDVTKLLEELDRAREGVEDMFSIRPPVEWWTDDPNECQMIQNSLTGHWSIHGRLVLYRNGMEWGSSVRSLRVKGNKFLNEVDSLRTYADAQLEFRQSQEYEKAVQTAEPYIKKFKGWMLQQGAESTAGFKLEIEQTWLVLKTPYHASDPVLFGRLGWTWLYGENSWLVNLAKMPVSSLDALLTGTLDKYIEPETVPMAAPHDLFLDFVESDEIAESEGSGVDGDATPSESKSPSFVRRFLASYNWFRKGQGGKGKTTWRSSGN